MKAVIRPIALIGAWVVVAMPGCIESSCEEKRTCGGSPGPTQTDAGSEGDLTLVPRSSGGRAGGNGFGLGGGPPVTGGASVQGGSAGREQEPAANGGETAAGGPPAADGGETATGGGGGGGEPSVSDAGAGGTEATPCGADSSAEGSCSPGESGSGGQVGTDGGAGGAAGQTDPGEAGSAGAAPTEGCDPEARVRKELLVDGRFEPSSSEWNLLNGTLLRSDGDAQSAPNYIVLAGFNEAFTSATQTVTFPPEAADIRLSFYVRIVSQNTLGDDVMYYGFTLEEGSVEIEAFAIEDESIPEWTFIEAGFPATYAGQTKELYFGGRTDAEPGFKWFFVDTVSVTALVCP